jgi:predicted ATPase/class 3 adenylate cyclase/DNA-binding SARP family transcriptional activator
MAADRNASVSQRRGKAQRDPEPLPKGVTEEDLQAVMTPDETAPPLTLRLLGPFEALVNGAPLLRLHSRKGLWLLALMALRGGRELERDWLACLLWPDSPETEARASLRNSLADLRRALGPAADRLQSPTRRTLCLDLLDAAVDICAFNAALARGDATSLEQAVALYRGPLLEDCAEEWAFEERQQYAQAYLTARETLAAQALAAGDPAAAERHLRRAVAADPLRESAQRALMQALAAGGSYAAALLVYRDLRQRLHCEIHAEPDPETQALFQQIRAEAREKAGARNQGIGAGRGSDASAVDLVSARTDSRPPPTWWASAPGPSGTVTFLFTDVEGSTRLWEQHSEVARTALARHEALLRQAIEAHGGRVFKTVGDQLCAAFPTAPAALTAALAGQSALQAEPWGQERSDARGGTLRVRMALHTGTAAEREGDYLGPALSRVARLLAAGHGDQVLLSQATCELVRDALPEGMSLRDLGEHRLKDLQQPVHLFQLLHPTLPADFPPLRSLKASAHNLPVQLTRFIGREPAIAEVKQRLAATHLLTLTGAGGCGKTRLALQVAAELVEEYADGVRLVELAPLADPTLVPQAVAVAFGLWEEPGRSLTETLVNYLRARSLLLLLDNCEHLLAACAQLAEGLLRACPNLRILASSREGLRVAGEQTYRVPSLTMPDPRHLPPVDSLGQYEAIQLFADRAAATTPGFAIGDHTAPAVAEVCHRLDGIPLAIELAAALVRALPVEQIATRLDDRFRLLTGGSRTALPRQQTLRALIDWSYDLLTEQERTLLRRLSVFAEGATLEAVVAVGAGDPVEEGEVLDRLIHLVDKSLVIYAEPGSHAERGYRAARYRLTETVRQYAGDRLLESGEAEAVRDRHLHFFVQLSERAQWHRIRDSAAKQDERYAQMAAEQSNLRTALGWSLGKAENAEAGLRLAGWMGRFWARSHQFQEGREWLEALLKRSRGAPPDARAIALEGACNLAFALGDHRSTRSYGEESLVLFRELGDPEHTAYTLSRLVYVAAAEGDLVSARSLAEEGLAISRKSGNKDAVAWGLGMVGAVARWAGDYPRARESHEASLAMARELGDWLLVGHSLCNLGNVLLKQADYGAARSSIEASLKIWCESREAVGTGHIKCLEAMAQLAVAQRQYERMARLFGAAEALREAIHMPLPLVDRADYDGVAEARQVLDEATFAAAWAEGRAMPLEEAVAFALEPEVKDGPPDRS